MREYRMFDDTAASVWEESYLVGNGRMGTSVMSR